MKRASRTVLLVGLLATSGCVGFVTGENALRFESGQVHVSQHARADTGYERTRAGEQVITKKFSAVGQTRRVKVSNYLAEYKRQVRIPLLGTQELARFTVLATPEVEVLGRTFNPVSDLSNRELAQRVQQKYTTIRNVRLVGNRTVQVLGEGVRVSKFAAEATTRGGQTIDVYVHIAKTEAKNDFIVAVAVYPQTLPREQQTVNRLLQGIKHESSAA